MKLAGPHAPAALAAFALVGACPSETRRCIERDSCGCYRGARLHPRNVDSAAGSMAESPVDALVLHTSIGLPGSRK